ncbi:MAG: EamA family transporter [Verrucomicrobia bacterium]|nr:EamA family transporter [Verrucomicrobiota bacterium]
MPWYLLVPFFSAALYALSSIFLKRGMKEGASAIYSFHVSNLVIGLCFLPLIFLEKQTIHWEQIQYPILTGVTFFIGSWFTFIAIHRGDVSLVTPLMGSKVIFVALFALVLASQPPSSALIIASVLSAIGIAVMGAKDFAQSSHAALTISLALTSSAVFALCDIFVRKWAPDFGPLAFLTVSTAGLALVSLVALILMARKNRASMAGPGPRKWIIWSSTLIGIQAIGMGYIISTNDDTTGINVVYGSRGLWAIILIVLVGPLLGNHERQLAKNVFLYRLVGTLLLMLAIVIAVMAGKPS